MEWLIPGPPGPAGDAGAPGAAGADGADGADGVIGHTIPGLDGEDGEPAGIYILPSAAPQPFTVGALITSNVVGVYPLWVAPFACTVTAVQAYVDTGNATVVNAGTTAAGTENFCSADITVDPADAWESGTVNQNQAVAAGETVSVEIVTAGTATQVNIQVTLARP
jgi:hypothetical protein